MVLGHPREGESEGIQKIPERFFSVPHEGLAVGQQEMSEFPPKEAPQRFAQAALHPFGILPHEPAFHESQAPALANDRIGDAKKAPIPLKVVSRFIRTKLAHLESQGAARQAGAEL